MTNTVTKYCLATEKKKGWSEHQDSLLHMNHSAYFLPAPSPPRHVHDVGPEETAGSHQIGEEHRHTFFRALRSLQSLQQNLVSHLCSAISNIPACCAQGLLTRESGQRPLPDDLREAPCAVSSGLTGCRARCVPYLEPLRGLARPCRPSASSECDLPLRIQEIVTSCSERERNYSVCLFAARVCRFTLCSCCAEIFASTLNVELMVGFGTFGSQLAVLQKLNIRF